MQFTSDQSAVSTPPAMTFVRMLEHIRYEGVYSTREQAEDVTRDVLAALGRRLTGEERVELATRLPREAAEILTAQIPEVDIPTGWAFVKELSSHRGGTLATTRWDVGSVLGVVARIAGPALLDRVLAQLPPGYAILFGRGELVQAV